MNEQHAHPQVSASDLKGLNERYAPWRIEKAFADAYRSEGGAGFVTQARNTATGETIYRCEGWSKASRGLALAAILERRASSPSPATVSYEQRAAIIGSVWYRLEGGKATGWGVAGASDWLTRDLPRADRTRQRQALLQVIEPSEGQTYSPDELSEFALTADDDPCDCGTVQGPSGGYLPHDRTHPGCSAELDAIEDAQEDADYEATQNPRPTLVTKTSAELAEGDVVHCHGMRVQLTELTTWHRERLVYSWRGNVLNLEDVRAAGVVPGSFIADGTWRVQGNDLARWAVEAPRIYLGGGNPHTLDGAFRGGGRS